MMTAPPPLSDLRVLELAGLAPAPFASLLLADYGASVLRIDRPHVFTPGSTRPTVDLLTRHKSSIALDLKSPSAVSLFRDLLQHADILIDPFRPGVLEGLGLDPTDLVQRNPKLIIARLTGFRRDGIYAHMAGHDINYLAVSGILSQFGPEQQPPAFPANVLADFAGGGLMCAFGILLALIERGRTGKGQVVQNNMVDGVAYLGTFMRFLRKTPVWDGDRGENLLDSGCPWYQVYECKDGRFMAVGALEPKFFNKLVKGLELLGVVEQDFGKGKWPDMKAVIEMRFKEKNRQEWEKIFEGTDACCTPVLEQAELEAMGYEQRLPVDLGTSPGREIAKEQAWASEGLVPGEGGEAVLEKWMGWRRGRHYEVVKGGLVKIEKAKL